MSSLINPNSKPISPPPPPLSPSSSSHSQPQPPPPPQSLDRQILNSSMEFTTSLHDVQDTSTIWNDWGDLLNFNDWSSVQPDPISDVPPSPEPLIRDTEGVNINDDDNNSDPGRVRKRDPRLACSNFLAGVVPCACPEVDEKMMELEEEEAGHGSKKRTRTVSAPTGVARRCQVPDCGADITELKGYHRRHRVCLTCANAITVVLDGHNKRYCQQCGKFHLLSDFDEDKRSCRRKLERHNNRRRRKHIDSKGGTGKESQWDLQSEDATCDRETGEDNLQLRSQIEREPLESEDGQISTDLVAPDCKEFPSDGFTSFVGSAGTQSDGTKYNAKYLSSPSYCEKGAYSSLCPTGRISFKLYDWNPAEFPRRLRLQIFQWLASMPVELEGYIRPGCTILTAFVAMPKFMWVKLLEDPVSYVHDFVVARGVLLGRGNVRVYLNNMVFHIVKGRSSVRKAKVEKQAPRLHYVDPICFEAGKDIEFVVCGSNLLQPKFRFLLSFYGKYLANDYFPIYSQSQKEGAPDGNFNHQKYRIHVPHTEADLIGPAFIEVENEAGLSNFLPVLIGDKETCSEMKIIQQRLAASSCLEISSSSASGCLSESCEFLALRQAAIFDVILDIAWLLKKCGSHNFQQNLTNSQIQRFNYLLNFLTSVESTAILNKVLQNLNAMLYGLKLNDTCSGSNYADTSYAREILRRKLSTTGPKSYVPRKDLVTQSGFHNDSQSVTIFSCQDLEIVVNDKIEVMVGSADERNESEPLSKVETDLKAKLMNEWPRKASGASGCSFSGRVPTSQSAGGILSFRPALYVSATTAICLGFCAIFFHPRKGSEFAVSVRRCLVDDFFTYLSQMHS